MPQIQLLEGESYNPVTLSAFHFLHMHFRVSNWSVFQLTEILLRKCPSVCNPRSTAVFLPCVWLIFSRLAAGQKQWKMMQLTESECSAYSDLGCPSVCVFRVPCFTSCTLPVCIMIITFGEGGTRTHALISSESNAMSQVQAKFISRSSPSTPSISINRDKGSQRSREVQNSVTSFWYCSQMFLILESSPSCPCCCLRDNCKSQRTRPGLMPGKLEIKGLRIGSIVA